MTTELDHLFEEFQRRRWKMYRWGPADDPALLAWVYDHGAFVDVVILRRDRVASGYRLPTIPSTDPFRPDAVVYQHHASAVYTLRAMLALPPPGTQGAPFRPEAPWDACVIPADLPAPVVIRPLGAR